MALDAASKTFVVYVAIQKQEKMLVHSKKQAQIGALLFDKVFIAGPAKYSNYSNVFLVENAAELPENTGINEFTIKVKKCKQLPFGPIYSLGLMELETLKTYIETILANSFIYPSKSPARASILFNKKLNWSLRLYMDYWGLNNIIIKNQYPLSLIGESLDWLGWARQFT